MNSKRVNEFKFAKHLLSERVNRLNAIKDRLLQTRDLETCETGEVFFSRFSISKCTALAIIVTDITPVFVGGRFQRENTRRIVRVFQTSPNVFRAFVSVRCRFAGTAGPRTHPRGRRTFESGPD